VHSVTLHGATDFAGWRGAARRLINEQVPPQEVTWSVAGDTASLFEALPTSDIVVAPRQTFTVPGEFLRLAATVALHCNGDRFALLYRVLWRLRQESKLLAFSMDPDVARLTAMAKSVSRDIHKMKAFVRFREVAGTQPRAFMAWFEPAHNIVEATAPFFARRFSNFAWAILTPDRSVRWDMKQLSFAAGANRTDAPSQDAAEDLWRRYYASIFNPARLKAAAMQAHMPKKYWRNLPETTLIPGMVATARKRTAEMIDKAPTHPARARRTASTHVDYQVENDSSLDSVRERAAHCKECPLWKHATQTVFGEGNEIARVMFVGEQPGDQEDLAGKPFVGPAGKLLDRALEQAGIDRSATYVTNAVKHFKFELRGKRRLHKKPGDLEISACNHWLGSELSIIKPQLIVVLGATAARSIFGKATPIEKNRGRIMPADTTGHGAEILLTVHPSYLLRVPDEDKDAAFERFVADLRLIRPYLQAHVNR
jgi:probable DNA metabolism protein